MTSIALLKHTIDLKSAQIHQELRMVSMLDREMSTEEEMIMLNVNIKLEEIRQFFHKIASDSKFSQNEKDELMQKVEEILSGSVAIARSEEGISSDERELLHLLKKHVIELRQVIHGIKTDH